jgi:hypothetical protein
MISENNKLEKFKKTIKRKIEEELTIEDQCLILMKSSIFLRM